MKTLGTLVTFGAVTAVTIGALNRDGNIRHDAGGEREVTPPPPPQRPAATAGREAAH